MKAREAWFYFVTFRELWGVGERKPQPLCRLSHSGPYGLCTTADLWSGCCDDSQQTGLDAQDRCGLKNTGWELSRFQHSQPVSSSALHGAMQAVIFCTHTHNRKICPICDAIKNVFNSVNRCVEHRASLGVIIGKIL